MSRAGVVGRGSGTAPTRSRRHADIQGPRLPRGYLPFSTQTLTGNIFVAYDKADRVTHRQAVGRGLGVVDEFSPDGRLISRITSGGALNARWGLAIAAASWGHAAGSLLAGNFGDGRINIVAKEGRHLAHRVTGLVRTSTGGAASTLRSTN